MSKSEWESRVGKLLDLPDFPYAYKPIDGPHGGAVKIDWLACDYKGRFWMIEVKWVTDHARSINLMNDISALQRDALESVAHTPNGVPLLAVGCASTLYIWHWSSVTWLWQLERDNAPKHPNSLALDTAKVQLKWTGIKNWKKISLSNLSPHLEHGLKSLV